MDGQATAKQNFTKSVARIIPRTTVHKHVLEWRKARPGVGCAKHHRALSSANTVTEAAVFIPGLAVDSLVHCEVVATCRAEQCKNLLSAAHVHACLSLRLLCPNRCYMLLAPFFLTWCTWTSTHADKNKPFYFHASCSQAVHTKL